MFWIQLALTNVRRLHSVYTSLSEKEFRVWNIAGVLHVKGKLRLEACHVSSLFGSGTTETGMLVPPSKSIRGLFLAVAALEAKETHDVSKAEQNRLYAIC